MQISNLHARWQSILAVIAVAITLALITSTGAHAQTNTDDSEPQTVAEQSEATDTTYVPENYRYTVEECNNFTLLVRKSIQLYDIAAKDVELSEAQIIYAETNIVRDLNGSDLIYVGDEINLDSETIATYVMSSRDLSEAQIAAWNVYAANARFDLDDINARNVGLSDDGDTVEVDETTGDPVASDSDTVDTSEPETEEDENEDSGIGWWVLGIGVVGTLWYLLWQRGGEEQ